MITKIGTSCLIENATNNSIITNLIVVENLKECRFLNLKGNKNSLSEEYDGLYKVDRQSLLQPPVSFGDECMQIIRVERMKDIDMSKPIYEMDLYVTRKKTEEEKKFDKVNIVCAKTATNDEYLYGNHQGIAEIFTVYDEEYGVKVRPKQMVRFKENGITMGSCHNIDGEYELSGIIRGLDDKTVTIRVKTDKLYPNKVYYLYTDIPAIDGITAEMIRKEVIGVIIENTCLW
jgi:hypothetical protein